MRILLLNAPLQSIVCDQGVGHQIPLGLLMIGGPLLDHSHTVRLLDAARHHLSDEQIVQTVEEFAADVVMIAHVGSTSAHPCCLRVLQAIKAAHPSVITVYGGVHPTYHDRAILTQAPQVDIIVRGEGEQTTMALVDQLAQQGAYGNTYDLSEVEGVSWRRRGEAVRNPARQPIEDLDRYRIGWELIPDWNCYQAFGLGRAAVVQFSRGCPHYCTYCGQWMFWKRWRHRSIQSFVDELQWLHEQHNIQFFWLADENPTTLKDVWSRGWTKILAILCSKAICYISWRSARSSRSRKKNFRLSGLGCVSTSSPLHHLSLFSRPVSREGQAHQIMHRCRSRKRPRSKSSPAMNDEHVEDSKLRRCIHCPYSAFLSCHLCSRTGSIHRQRKTIKGSSRTLIYR